jgi:PleD family two-component response regulator
VSAPDLSCGVAALGAWETASQLMRRADRALDDAKAAGRARAALDGAASGPSAADAFERTTAPAA